MKSVCEPWEDGRVFYIGIAVDVDDRLKEHITEAKETCLVLTKSPNMARFLADFLNGCPNTAAVLEEHAHESPFKTFFFRTPTDYLKAWAGSGCTVEADTVRVGDSKAAMIRAKSRRGNHPCIIQFEVHSCQSSGSR